MSKRNFEGGIVEGGGKSKRIQDKLQAARTLTPVTKVSSVGRIEKERRESSEASGSGSSYNVNVFKTQTETKCIEINTSVITQFLVKAVTAGNAPSLQNRPIDLHNPREECYAIAKGLSMYATQVTPKESLSLFPNPKCSENPTPSKSFKSGKKGQQRRGKKDWIFLSNLDQDSDHFNKMKSPMERESFEKKMLSVMKASMVVDANNWTLSEVGFILAFWLAKLYNAQGFNDGELPKELYAGKEHFLELNGYQYDYAEVTIDEPVSD